MVLEGNKVSSVGAKAYYSSRTSYHLKQSIIMGIFLVNCDLPTARGVQAQHIVVKIESIKDKVFIFLPFPSF